MNTAIIKVKCKENAVLPSYKTEQAAGADVCAFLEKNLVLKAHERALIPTGLFFEIPLGFEVQVRPRSGLALKNGITVLNSPGTIDSDYRGELKILLINLGREDFLIKNGDRIAQIVICPVVQAEFESVLELNKSLRGEDGFGSTGV